MILLIAVLYRYLCFRFVIVCTGYDGPWHGGSSLHPQLFHATLRMIVWRRMSERSLVGDASQGYIDDDNSVTSHDEAATMCDIILLPFAFLFPFFLFIQLAISKTA